MPRGYALKRPSLDPCPIEAVVGIVGGKWKARILYALWGEALAFGQIQAALGPALSREVLATQLQALRRDGMVEKEGPVGRGATYRLTPRGRSLVEVLLPVAAWSVEELLPEGARWPGA